MFVHQKHCGGIARRLIGVGAVVCFGISASCGSNAGNVSAQAARPTLGLSLSEFDDPSTFYESKVNDLLESAEAVPVIDASQVIRGEISTANDVDVYDLGPINPGDRVFVDMSVDPSLKAAIALFDGSSASLLVNDHRNVYLGRSEPFVDVVARRWSDHCFIAVASTPDVGSTGGYALMATITPATPIPPPNSDVFLLDFNGGTGVRIGGRAAIDVPPFDADDIDPRYDGETERMIEFIVRAVREDYAWSDVLILSTSEGDQLSGNMSRLYFGDFDSALLGVAEGVDEYNATKSQQAIVFTDTFAAFLPLNPSTEELAQAMANVASHEIGHLLGLVHTQDPTGIMDVTASLRDLMRDQSFEIAEIYPAVFPIGFQNDMQYLLDSVGGDPEWAMDILREQKTREKSIVSPSGPPARELFYLSSCGLESDDQP